VLKRRHVMGITSNNAKVNQVMQKEFRRDLYQQHSETTNKEVILKFKENITFQITLIFEHKSVRFREWAGFVTGIPKSFESGSN
jgi:hypothetical protein